MNHTELIEKLGKIVDEKELLLSTSGDEIRIHAEFFYRQTSNRINRLLNLYGECDWWIEPSSVLDTGVMFKIKILKF